MDESVHVGNNGPAPPKPPLSVGRIAGEILAGTVTGCAAAVLAVHAILFAMSGSLRNDCMPFGAILLAYLGTVFHGPGSAVGVYLVGSIGRQTGSLVATLACGLLGWLLMVVMGVAAVMRVGLEDIVVWSVLLIPPITATWGFNSTRKWGSHRLAWFRGTALAVLLLAACATLLMEVRTYARDRARGQIKRMNSQYATQTELIKGLQSRDARVREAAARALGNRGYTAKPAVPALVDALKDEDEVVRQRARAALERIDPNWSRTVKPE